MATSPAEIFSWVLFAWTAMGAAFGPLLLVRLWRGAVSPPASFAAMLSGFVLAVAFYWIPATRGGPVERVVPFLVAGAIAWWGQVTTNRGQV